MEQRNNIPRQQTISQLRAASAWAKVREPEVNNDYRSYARDLPSSIMRDGLAQALAFMKAKGTTHHKLLYKHISEWLCQKFNHDSNDALELLLDPNTDSGKYRRIQREALAYLQWIKRFSEAGLK